MRYTLLFVLAAAVTLPAQVRFTPGKTEGALDRVAVDIDGKPFAVFHYGAEVAKPYIAPVRSASGKIVTRRYPMERVEGESRDHLHHTDLWFSYDDVNGIKFWENHPSYTKQNMGRMVVRNAEWKDDDRAGKLTAAIDWVNGQGKAVLKERRAMVFYSEPRLRTIDFQITLTPPEDVIFGDTKEGAFAIRLAENFTEKKGVKIVDADGRTGMANVWGKRSNWVDYSAEVDGERIGVAMFDHPSNERHPTYWHARDYGLFALNPFGRKAFDPSQEESHWKLPAGKDLVFRWRVVIHPADSNVAELYKDYAR